MPRTCAPLLGLLLGICGGPGCTTDGGSTADDDAAGDDDDTYEPVDGCDRYTTWGYFHLTVDDDNPPETWIGGMVEDGPEPWILDEIRSEGDCTLYAWDHRPICEPECIQPEYCGYGDQCHPMPAVISVGTVDVSGTSPAVTLQEIDNGVYIGGEDFPDLYTPGDTLTVTATGGSSIGPFQLTVPGVAPLDPHCEELTMSPGQDLVCTWTPGTVADARFRFTLYKSDQHGALPAELVCITDDDAGTLTVPTSLVDAIWAMDVFDGLNPVSGNVQRYTEQVIQTERGCIEMRSQTQTGPVYLTFEE